MPVIIAIIMESVDLMQNLPAIHIEKYGQRQTMMYFRRYAESDIPSEDRKGNEVNDVVPSEDRKGNEVNDVVPSEDRKGNEASGKEETR